MHTAWRPRSCKVADFGLSRRMDNDYYRASSGGAVPLRWTAIEVLTASMEKRRYACGGRLGIGPLARRHASCLTVALLRYTLKTDIWSFGVLLHEVFDNGEKPYKDMANAVVVARVSQGYRLPRLPECPESVYALMLRCWSEKGDDRPTFQAMTKLLETERKGLDPKALSIGSVRRNSALVSLQGSRPSCYSAAGDARGSDPGHEYVYQIDAPTQAAQSVGPATAPRPPRDYVYQLGDAAATLTPSLDGFAEDARLEGKPMVVETRMDEYIQVAVKGEMEA